MKMELDTWQKEENLLQKIATDQGQNTKGRQDMNLQLRTIEQEMEDTNGIERNLRNQLDGLQVSYNRGGKSVHRIEMPIVGQLDRPDLQTVLMKPAWIGAAIFTSVFLVVTTLHSLGRTD